jgi:hypothetical protein
MLRKFVFLFIGIFILAACSAPQLSGLTPAASKKSQDVSATVAPSPTKVPATTAAELNNDPNLVRADSQGSVEFLVVPKNLDAPADTLDFLVEMNTHSVDLSWNLAAQSTLTADNGLSVIGSSWPASNGHHAQGTLKFPTKTTDGKPLLENAKKLTLTIKDAGAPTRVFEWILSK